MPSSHVVAVLGGGSAGLTAAATAREAGARVILFIGEGGERASTCINAGCMPAKALFEPLDALHRAQQQGWPTWRRGGDVLEQVVRRKDREIARFRAFHQQSLRRLEEDGLEVVAGCARLVEPHVVESGGRRWTVDAVVLATGSARIEPEFEGWADVRASAWSSDDVLDNTTLPDSLVIIGAGAVGMQFSLRYARLGCTVTIVTDGRVLPRFPRRFGERLATIYEGEGIRVLTERRVTRVRRDGSGWFVVDTDGADGSEPLVAERLLVAVGRRPQLARVGLEVLGVSPDAAGSLAIDEDLRVHGTDHVFAAGDVVGYRMSVHLAHLEARVAAWNAATGDRRQRRNRANIKVIYTDPELAFAGVDGEAIALAGHRVVTASKESRLVGRLHLAGDDDGFGEMFADAQDGRLLGAGLLCHDASVLIHLPAYAIQHGHTVEQALEAEFYHPTKMGLVEGVLERLQAQVESPPSLGATRT